MVKMARRAGSLALLAATFLASEVSARAARDLRPLGAGHLQADYLGVPHLTAVSLEDAFRVRGWVATRDRLFQMDRLAASRALAELRGNFLDLETNALAKRWSFFLRGGRRLWLKDGP
jgi:acyl-homoserine lactone acylase PvdQ